MIGTDDSVDISKALDTLSHGGIILSPTDTVWGLVCDFESAEAISRVFEIKKGKPRPVVVLCDNFHCLDQIEIQFTPIAKKIAGCFWPGPVTLVLKSNSRRISCVSGENNTIGVRIPDCVDLKELIRGFGKPLAATSANYIGQKPPRLQSEIPGDIISKVGFTWGFKITPSGVASTVIDCTSAKLIIIRQGEISLEDIQRALGDL